MDLPNNDLVRIELTSKDITRRVALHVPFVLLVAFATALLGGGLLLFIYSFVAVAAMKSAMVFLIVFGCGILAIGVGLGCIEAFRLYLNYYNEREKFIKRAPKTEIKKNPLSFANICLYVMIAGSVFVLISAALGSIKPESWVTEKTEYLEENGYYAESKTFQLGYDVEDREVQNVSISLNKKNAVIIYTTENSGLVEIKGYCNYENQIAVAYGDNTVYLTDTPSPRQNRAKDKMLFFMFEDSEVEAQIQIIIPEYYRAAITIVGEYVVAQN